MIFHLSSSSFSFHHFLLCHTRIQHRDVLFCVGYEIFRRENAQSQSRDETCREKNTTDWYKTYSGGWRDGNDKMMDSGRDWWNEETDVRENKRKIEYTIKLYNEWANKTSKRINKQKDGQMDEWMDEQTDRRANKQVDRGTDGRTDWRVDGWMV